MRVGERPDFRARPGALEVRVFAMSLIAALTETTAYWAEHGHEDDLGELVDRALSMLVTGFGTGGPQA
ncbi:hypothetical protein [Streptomyces sp. NPDC051218]|uniref:acyl-CoA-like ligand-binding transcription factor n=1 Tax=Streptomyces sp. NPDC051218 TaxID=3365645 RepID=UPI0037A46B61